MITTKQRAYLRGLANKIEPIVQIGKGEVGENLVKQVSDALAARELVKGSCLETASVTPREAVQFFAEQCDAEIVQVIGRRFVLYKPAKKPVIVLPEDKKA